MIEYGIENGMFVHATCTYDARRSFFYSNLYVLYILLMFIQSADRWV